MFWRSCGEQQEFTIHFQNVNMLVPARSKLLGLLRRLNTEFRKTIIIVTHDAHAAEKAGQVLHLDKGVLAT